MYVFSLACKNKECIHLSKSTQSLTVCVDKLSTRDKIYLYSLLQKISSISLVNSKNIQYSVVISRVHAKYGKIFKDGLHEVYIEDYFPRKISQNFDT
jgi:hypothetical protein